MKFAHVVLATLIIGASATTSASAEGWWRFGAKTAAEAPKERWVSHFSHQLILQRNGRYVPGTIRKSLPVVAKQAAKKAAPYAAGAAVGATAPAWAPVAVATTAVIGLGYTGYEVYGYARERLQ